MNTLSMPDTEINEHSPDLFSQLVSGASASLTPYDIRCRIAWLQEELLKLAPQELGDPDELLPIKHIFTEGAYAREIFIPAGLIVIGKIHRHEHLNFISKGSVTVVTEQGGVERLTGTCTMVSPPGTKRALFAHEDTVWTTVHVTDETDLKKIEEVVIAESYAELGMVEPTKSFPSKHTLALVDAQ